MKIEKVKKLLTYLHYRIEYVTHKSPYSPLGKALEKQTKTIENQGKK